MIKNLVILLLLIPFEIFGQGKVNHLFEELPSDSTYHNDLTSHTSLKPIINYDPSPSKKLILNGLADMNASYDTSFAYRAGLGLEIDYMPTSKWHIRLAAVQGYGNQQPGVYPKSFLRFDDPSGYGYTDIRSRMSFTPNKFFNFQIGLDHNFIGEGSRSLLLSDYGTSYPFALIRTHFWRLEYNVMYQFLREGSPGHWDSKFAATHHLSFNASKWLNIGLFESVLFQPVDTNLRRGFDVEYLNPVIFYRPQEYSLGSSDNVIMGIDLSAKFANHTLYGQFVIDEFSLTELKAKSGWWANKYGAQLGVKGHYLNNTLFSRLEYNFMRPYTFSHISEALNYGNQGYPISHPYGANFMEILAELKYQKEKLLLKLFANYVLTGLDHNGYSYGGNIYQNYANHPNEFGNFIGQGIQQNRAKIMITGAYQLLKNGKLNVFVENHFNFIAQNNQMSYQVVAGVRSFLWNDYRNY